MKNNNEEIAGPWWHVTLGFMIGIICMLAVGLVLKYCGVQI